MGSNGLVVSVREFDRDTLIDRLEGWIGQLQGDATSLSASRGSYDLGDRGNRFSGRGACRQAGP